MTDLGTMTLAELVAHVQSALQSAGIGHGAVRWQLCFNMERERLSIR